MRLVYGVHQFLCPTPRQVQVAIFIMIGFTLFLYFDRNRCVRRVPNSPTCTLVSLLYVRNQVYVRSPVLARIGKPNSLNEIRRDQNMFNTTTVFLTTLILLDYVLNICLANSNFCCSFAITSLPKLYFEVRPQKDCQKGKNGTFMDFCVQQNL